MLPVLVPEKKGLDRWTDRERDDGQEGDPVRVTFFPFEVHKKWFQFHSRWIKVSNAIETNVIVTCSRIDLALKLFLQTVLSINWNVTVIYGDLLQTIKTLFVSNKEIVIILWIIILLEQLYWIILNCYFIQSDAWKVEGSYLLLRLEILRYIKAIELFSSSVRHFILGRIQFMK